jgi:hypothetical protein
LQEGSHVSIAGRAIVRGIEHRARKVYAPPWVLPLLYARGVLDPVVELIGRDENVEEAIRMADSTARAAQSVNGSRK